MKIQAPLISIIIPSWNEADNILVLVSRINVTLKQAAIPYEIIMVDDNSTDSTNAIVTQLTSLYPISLIIKDKSLPRGKAASLLLGFKAAQAETVAMIDADLQYPPEVLPDMFNKLNSGADVVVANRNNKTRSFLRRVASNTFRSFFGKLLYNFEVDIQSGLKLFRKEIVERAALNPKSPWMFDLEFLTFAREAGYSIGSVDIAFAPRFAGKTKINLLTASLDMATSAVKLKLRRPKTIAFHPAQVKKHGYGFHYRGKAYVNHSTLPHHESAFIQIILKQKIILLGLFLLLIAGFLFNWHASITVFMGLLTIFYLSDLLFSLFVISRNFTKIPEIQISDESVLEAQRVWPKYTILCPMYKESSVLTQFINAIEKLNYPVDKLQVILLLEADDQVSLNYVANLTLPSQFETLVVPHSIPKTKPKALNFGLHHATGEYVVVYDAEDIPDALQLKKVVLAFERESPKTICVQAKLNFYNPQHNLLTRLFTAEYSLWFDLILTGLQSINAPIPLGGTSNHFRLAELIKLHGWDAFNVTEDCDLGIRLAKRGYKTAIVDSTTMEEANSNLLNWFGQRSRWIKGYIQTYFVHMRSTRAFTKESSTKNLVAFQLVVGGKILSLFINPLMWLITIIYFVFRPVAGTFIESFFPAPVLYMGVISLIFGNFIYLYSYMVGVIKREQWWLAKYVFVIPFYWLAMSLAAWKALKEFIFSPFYWSKTVHGLHLKKMAVQVQTAQVAEATGLTPTRPRILGTITTGGFLIFATMVANVCNYLINAYLGRSVSLEQFGLVALITNLINLIQIPLSAYSRTISYQSAFLLGKFETPVKQYWKRLRMRAWLPTLGCLLIWFGLIPVMQNYFQSTSILPFLLLTPLWVVGIVDAVDTGFLSGNLRFGAMAAMLLVEMVSKLTLVILLVKFNLQSWVFAAFSISSVLSFLVGWWAVVRMKSTQEALQIEHAHPLPKGFFVSSTLIKIAGIAFLSLDVLLAKHYLSPKAAGQYALLSLVGKMVYFLGTLFAQFIVPIVSHREGAGHDSKQAFSWLFGLTALCVAIGVTAFGIFGFITVPFLLGAKAGSIITLLPLYTLAMGCFALSQTIVSYEQTRKHNLFAVVNILLVISVLVTIGLFHDSVATINLVISAGSIASLLVVVLLHGLYSSITPVFNNTRDLLSLFSSEISLNKQDRKLRILIFNWRDTKHSWAGGAESYIHEMSKRWVSLGYKVTVFCSNDSNHKRNQVVDGVQVVRRGGFYTVYIWAILYYILRFKGNFDVVIDSENGIPFFTPLFVSTPTFLLIYHVHQEVFRNHLRFPLSQIAMFLESRIMPLVYRKTSIITISESSKKAIIKLGFTNTDQIYVVNPGLDVNKFGVSKKTTYPSIVYLGRLRPYKHVDVAIRAFARIFPHHQTAKFTIAGEGISLPGLQKLVSELKLTKAVSFLGKVSEADKVNLLSTSWMMVQPSSVEGWGMTVVESNACGTPVIASDVNGLCDSVIHLKTGLLVTPRNIRKLAISMRLLIENTQLRKELSREARSWSAGFDWNDSAQRFLRILFPENNIPQLMKLKNINFSSL